MENAFEHGLLRPLIADSYTPKSLSAIREALESRHTHEISPVAHGLYAASPGQSRDSATGYQNVWVRDNVMVANSLFLRGDTASATSCIRGITQFFKKQLPRFREIIDDPVRVVKEDANRRPHIRFTAPDLGELPDKWPHAQNDALGHALWFRFQLANAGVLALTPEDEEVYGSFPEYFDSVEYWQDRDSGAWEEGRKINNSSVGAVVAGLEEMLKHYVSSNRRGKAPPVKGARLDRLRQLAAKGRVRLDATLPFEAPPERLVDSALLFLIYPLSLLRSRVIEDAILNLVQARLKGVVGIKRYAGDSYFCQDYDEWFSPSRMSSDFSERLDYRDAFLQPNCEAQWCIFDPLLSVVYGQRYLADRSDTASLCKQTHYFNRSLAQVTAGGQCPELYFLKEGSYVPNAHTPLAWTQANQALALYLMEKSLGVAR
jgi:GH15 family glucan-1,4-alpha-glucosidase